MEPRQRDTRDHVTPAGSGVGRAIVIGPYRREAYERGQKAQPARSPAARLDEAVGLARAIDLEVVDAGLAPLTDIQPASYIGKGKVEEFAGLEEADEFDLGRLERIGGVDDVDHDVDAEAGFYVRHGYQTMLLLQWAHDPGRFDAEVEALAAGPVKEMTWHQDSFGGVPQLFVDLDEPSPVVRAQVQDLVSGAHVGYCMTKAINAQNEPTAPGPG